MADFFYLNANWLIPVGAAGASAALFWRFETGRGARRRFLKVVGGAVLFAVGGMLLVGLPGALVYEAAKPVAWLVLGRDSVQASENTMGAGMWAIAIEFTMVWPASVVFAYAVAYGPLRSLGRRAHIALLVLIPYAAAVAMALVALKA